MKFYTTVEANSLIAQIIKQTGGTLHNVIIATGFSSGSFKYVMVEGKVVFSMSGSQSPGRRIKLWIVDIGEELI